MLISKSQGNLILRYEILKDIFVSPINKINSEYIKEQQLSICYLSCLELSKNSYSFSVEEDLFYHYILKEKFWKFNKSEELTKLYLWVTMNFLEVMSEETDMRVFCLCKTTVIINYKASPRIHNEI